MKRFAQASIDYMRLTWVATYAPERYSEIRGGSEFHANVKNLKKRAVCELALLIDQKDLRRLTWRNVDFLTWQIVIRNRKGLKIASISDEFRKELECWRNYNLAYARDGWIPRNFTRGAFEDIPVLWEHGYVGYYATSLGSMRKIWTELEMQAALMEVSI